MVSPEDMGRLAAWLKGGSQVSRINDTSIVFHRGKINSALPLRC